MSDLKTVIADARYAELIELAGALIAEFGEDPSAAAETASPHQQAMAAAMYRWAVGEGPRPNLHALPEEAAE